MSRNWTSAQSAAIEARGHHVLVSAGAGSGKTAVLVERLLHLLTDAQNPLDIDRILVVTFTNAAAEEMRSRLGKALAALARERSGDAHILRQLALLPQASILTLHSFCLDLIRRYFYHLNLDANLKVASELEQMMLREEVLEKYLESRYAAGDATLPLLADAYGGNQDDSGLLALIQDIHAYSKSHPQPDAWLDRAVAAFAAPDIDAFAWSDFLAGEIRAELAGLAQNLAAILDQSGDIPLSWLTLCQQERDGLQALAAMEGPLSLLLTSMAAFSFAPLPSAKEGDATDKKDLQKGREGVKKAYRALCEHFCTRSPQTLAKDLNNLAPLMAGLVELVRGYDAELAAEKRRRNLLDFYDMEHFCLRLLEDAQLDVAAALREQYVEILVDEYQDINAVQERILTLLNNGHNLFTVGDIKQCIYRFRLAEPSIFLARYHGYAADARAGERIDLNLNFRSTARVLETVNFFFQRLMNQETAGLSYDAAASLRPGRAEEGTPSELLLLNRAERKAAGPPALSAWEEECEMLAKRIDSLHREGYRYRDIAILLRSPRNKENVLCEILNRYDIPALATAEANSLDSPEVALIISLLEIIDNPRQDIPLAAVLRSPFGGFDADALVLLRREYAQQSLYDALLSAAEAEPAGPWAAFLDKLGHWRALAQQQRISSLLWQLYQESGFYHLAGALAGGRRRQANLQSLYRYALEYESGSYKGLFRFLRFLADLQKRGYAIPSARLLGEEEDVVQIMSVHRSKGLEFPVVFVAGLGGRFNLREANRDLLLDPDFGLGPKVVNRRLRFKFPTLAHEAIGRKMRRESLAEELRILYVAMTRAREKLILSGSVANLEKSLTRWQKGLDSHLLLTDASPLDWLGRALCQHPAFQPVLERYGFAPSTPLAAACPLILHLAAPMHQSAAAAAAAPALPWQKRGGMAPSTSNRPIVEAALNYQYPGRAACDFAAKWTVSQAMELLDDSPAFLPIREAVAAGNPYGAEEAAQRGRHYHRFLELLDLQHVGTEAEISAQAQVFVEAGFLPADCPLAALCTAAYRLFCSPLGARILASPQVLRELEFTYAMPLTALAELGLSLPPMEGLVLQGQADLLFWESAGWVLLDYKSGGSHKSEDALVARYQKQVAMYRRALTDIHGFRFQAAYLYMVDDGRLIPLPV